MWTSIWRQLKWSGKYISTCKENACTEDSTQTYLVTWENQLRNHFPTPKAVFPCFLLIMVLIRKRDGTWRHVTDAHVATFKLYANVNAYIINSWSLRKPSSATFSPHRKVFSCCSRLAWKVSHQATNGYHAIDNVVRQLKCKINNPCAKTWEKRNMRNLKNASVYQYC